MLHFTAQDGMADSDEVWLVFDGVDTVGDVYVNQQVRPVSLTPYCLDID